MQSRKSWVDVKQTKKKLSKLCSKFSKKLKYVLLEPCPVGLKYSWCAGEQEAIRHRNMNMSLEREEKKSLLW